MSLSIASEQPAPQMFERYLRLLGLEARSPELEALRELTAAHLYRIPFENLSKLLYRHDPAMHLPTLDRFLDGVETYGLGGTCYSNNYHFSLLLGFLGYDVRFCGADMSRPDVHVVNVVTLAGREYLVDVGYGAPFAEPMPLDRRDDVVVALGTDRYRLRPREPDGRSTLEMHRDGRLRHGYRLNPRGRRIEEFADVIESSFAPEATFMNALVIIRFQPGASTSLHNLSLRESRDLTGSASGVPGVPALPATIEARFGIAADVARRALQGVDLSRDVYG
jgi:N-hydroxyarylamine O-acetyltransferase